MWSSTAARARSARRRKRHPLQLDGHRRPIGQALAGHAADAEMGYISSDLDWLCLIGRPVLYSLGDKSDMRPAMIVGYARTSTAEQRAGLDGQERDLAAAGAERV